MVASPVLCVVLISFCAVPVAYSFNLTASTHSPLLVASVGILVLAAILGLVLILFRRNPPRDPVFYMCAVFAFTSVIDLLLSLEQDGLIRGYLVSYILHGEPYLSSAHGISICYWDGTVHYLLYLLIAYLISHRLPYREVGLYWLGSMVMGMVVFLPGNILGKYGSDIKPSFLLNVPYVAVPLWAGTRILTQPRSGGLWGSESRPHTKQAPPRPLSQRPWDVLFLIYLVFATSFCVFRGFVSLQCPQSVCFDYLHLHEPYLRDPTAYPRVQMLVSLFYVVPACVWLMAAVVGEWRATRHDLTLTLAGAIAQSQFSLMWGSVHPHTAFIYRACAGPSVGWALNLLLAAPPQLAAAAIMAPSIAYMLRGEQGGKRETQGEKGETQGEKGETQGEKGETQGETKGLIEKKTD